MTFWRAMMAAMAPATAPAAITAPTSHWTAVFRVENHARNDPNGCFSPLLPSSPRAAIPRRATVPADARARLGPVDERRRLRDGVSTGL